MYKFFSIFFFFLTIGSFGQNLKRYDSTLKIGKVGFRVTCINKSVTQNNLNIKPIGFKSEAREVSLELKARVISSEIDDLNQKVKKGKEYRDDIIKKKHSDIDQ